MRKKREKQPPPSTVGAAPFPRHGPITNWPMN